MQARTLTPLNLCGYGLGSISNAAFNTVPGLLLLDYMVNVLAIAPDTAAIAIFIPKLFALFADTVVGALSDRTKALTGKRYQWLTAGTVLLPVAIIGVFVLPAHMELAHRVPVLILAYLFATASFSLFAVPYVAVAAELSPDYHERTRILAYRVSFIVIGILASGALAPLAIKHAGGGVEGYRFMAYCMAAICLLVMAASTQTIRGLQRTDISHKTEKLTLAVLASVLRNRAFVTLGLSYVVLIVGVNCMLATVPFYARYWVGGSEEVVTLIFVCNMLPSLLTMPLWQMFSKRYGKLAGLRVSMVIYVLAATSLIFIDATNVVVLYSVIAVMGVGFAGIQLFPFSMLPDVIDQDEASELHREGLYSGLWLALEKAAFAFGATAAGLVLAIFGYQEGQGQYLPQDELAVQGVLIAFAVVPAVVMLLALMLSAFIPSNSRDSLDSSATP